MDENKITITLENGEELLCEVLLTHHLEETGFDYVIFELPDGEISAARYTDNGDSTGQLSDVETDEEWELIDAVLEDYYDQLDDEEEIDE